MADAAPAPHVLEVKNLSVEFHSAGKCVKAVRDVSFHVDRGETLAILGESGSGKSVSASAIMDLIDCPPGRITSGEISYRGRDLLNMPAAERRHVNGRKIAMIFQDPLAHLNPVYPVGWQIAEAMRVHGMPAAAAKARAIELMARVGLKDPAARAKAYPHQFSGGQRQRLMIAMALAYDPDVLIADEPTTALDVTVQLQILRLLQQLRDETGMGLLLITHDLGVVAEMAERVIVMNAGEVVETGTTRDVFKAPRHPYTQKLIGAVPGQGGMRTGSVGAEPPILEVRKLEKYFGAYHALRAVSFDLHAGETVAIVGESGSGKSTTARAILRLDDADSGEVIYRGRDLTTLSDKEMFALRRDIQMVFQDPTQSLNPRMSVFQIVSEAWRIHRDILPKERWRARVLELLDLVGLKPDHADRYPHQFSGGQRQRIAIARALAVEPRIIICDEAVSALDVSVQGQVIRLLDDLRHRFGVAFIFIAHDLPVVRDFADRVIVMKDGAIVETGTVAQIFEAPVHPYTRALLAASLEPDPDLRGSHDPRPEEVA
ncbi:ABC transporter ATP-binding protein [Methylobrevis albus]|uniref:ABC transporter ATP-binding protein n=1 Tax=Methylobrevis albus TaxID=2793297 RepID=A0A931I614_9HYPH|nr:ABC transporter ATP-binding protein [Methylobrevis albus]MBH0239481.1 ABC transporter ATP-binding protein [Methylobrevis albus]